MSNKDCRNKIIIGKKKEKIEIFGNSVVIVKDIWFVWKVRATC